MISETAAHPCFDKEARHRFARIHLPVAPECNIACNYCNRKFDCANENRPGVASAVLSPGQACAYFQRLRELISRPISVVGIAGPGDPFANAEATLETLRLVREADPDVLLCVATNGLCVAPHAGQLAALHVSHVTITINAVDPAIGARVYRWVRPERNRVLRGQEGAALLWDRQRLAVGVLKDAGLTVKINTIIIPGVNDEHMAEVSQELARLGADVQNCIPIYPVADTPFETILSPEAEQVRQIRMAAGSHLPQMEHCARCRADAAGLLGEENAEQVQRALSEAAQGAINPGDNRPYTAVASMEGMLINQHLGQAEILWIFEVSPSGAVELIAKRPAPPPGGGDERWRQLAGQLHDCKAILATQAGRGPTEALARYGIRVVLAEGLIEIALQEMASGRQPLEPVRKRPCSCSCDSSGKQTGCRGSGVGCL